MPQQLVSMSQGASPTEATALPFQFPVRLIAAGLRVVATATSPFACGIRGSVLVGGLPQTCFTVGVEQAGGTDVTYCFSRGLGTVISATGGTRVFISAPLPEILITPEMVVVLGFIGGTAEPALVISAAYIVVSFSGKERTRSQRPTLPEVDSLASSDRP